MVLSSYTSNFILPNLIVSLSVLGVDVLTHANFTLSNDLDEIMCTL